MSNANAPAALLRAALKAELGANARQVSVRHDKYSMGSTIYVVVKDPAVSLAAVRELAERFEIVHRDSTGEILGGGNRFVRVSYSDEAIAPTAGEFAAVLATLEPGASAELRGITLRRCEDGDYYEAQAEGWDAAARIHCWSAKFCAEQVAERVLSSQPAKVAA